MISGVNFVSYLAVIKKVMRYEFLSLFVFTCYRTEIETLLSYYKIRVVEHGFE